MFSPDQWAASTGVAFYNGVATQSLRLDSGSSPYLTRTPSSAGNKKTWTWSAWIKRSSLESGSPYGGFGILFAGGNEQNMWAIPANCTLIAYWINSEQLAVVGTGNTVLRLTNARQRDLSSWYHFVVTMDTTQATANDRTKVYINGVQQTSFDTTNNVSQNTDLNINETSNHLIGGQQTANSASYMNMYLAETNFVDGTALDASYFGEFKNGVWIPKEYTGSYGTNGFRLQFNQTGTGTASSSTIGADTSGNANHFTSSGIVASDCDMPDSPENNFCTFNGVDTRFRSELLEGNLNLRATTYSSGNWGHSICTFKIPSSGKWYIEAYGLNITGNNTTSIGIMDRNVVSTSATTVNYGITTDEGFDGIRQGHYSSPFMRIMVDGTQSGSDISFTNQSAISALAIDVDNGYIYVGGNDGTGGTGSEITWRDYADGSTGSSNVDPTSGSSGTGGIARTFTNNDIIVCDVSVSGDNSSKSQVYLNAGQDSSFAGNLTAQGNSDANGVGDFYYQVPDGYLALCSANLPEPTISPNADTQADDYFNTVTFTGTGSTRSVTGVGFQPDWIWFKRRDGAVNHALYDVIRGGTNALRSNTTGAEAQFGDAVVSFETDGFEIAGTNVSGINGSSESIVSWNWKAGGTAVSNTDGSITSSVSANTDAGFSIVTFTGNKTRGATIGHGLGVKPDMIIMKNRQIDVSWVVWFPNLQANNQLLELNSTGAVLTNTGDPNAWWNNTAPTSSVITLGDYDGINDDLNMVAYCFNSVEGYSKFGGYTGNDSTDGNFIYLGFRPSFIIIKYTSGTAGGTKNWFMFDDARDTFNPTDDTINANASDGETADSNKDLDFLSNGFKIRNAEGAINNAAEYIYMAWASSPFKYSNAR